MCFIANKESPFLSLPPSSPSLKLIGGSVRRKDALTATAKPTLGLTDKPGGTGDWGQVQALAGTCRHLESGGSLAGGSTAACEALR